MSLPSIADLEAAVVAGALDGCLRRMSDDGMRLALRRALEIDRGLWTEFPASLGSCLLARTLDDPVLSDLHGSWTSELARRRQPWVRPLRSLPIPEGLLAELRDDKLAAAVSRKIRFESDEVVTILPHEWEGGQRRRLDVGATKRWAWQGGAALSIEPGTERAAPASVRTYPKINSGSWAPAHLYRSVVAQPVALPSPPDADARARFSSDGGRVFVYGSLDDYAGGYLWIIDPDTLQVQRKIATRQPVTEVHECVREDVLVLRTHGGLVGCIGGQTRDLLYGDVLSSDCLAPGGDFLASMDKVLRVWSTFELLRRGPPPVISNIQTCFDPSGDRLLSGRMIFDGHTGQAVAQVDMELHSYLEGGPARPWLNFGARHLMCIYNGLQVWDTRSGAALEIEERGLHYPQWFSLAHDRAGTSFAALRSGASEVRLHELPSGRVIRDLRFSLKGHSIAMSPDGKAIAVQQGKAMEVRSDEGDLLRFIANGSVSSDRGAQPPWRVCLRFSADGHRVARLDPGFGWRISPPDDVGQEMVVAENALEEVPGFMPPRPPEWSVQTGARTIFTHRPSRTRIAFPALGPWVSSPDNPHVMACDETHVVLRGA